MHIIGNFIGMDVRCLTNRSRVVVGALIMILAPLLSLPDMF
ncbi:hypothetical protein BH10PSE12_BH10PSE12_28090 [soil metagenome]